MTKSHLKTDQFIQYAQAYGADFNHWPQADIESATQLLKELPELQVHLDAQRQLDRLLDQHSVTTTAQNQLVLNRLEADILEKTALSKTLIDVLFEWLSPQASLWRPALAACLPIMLGLSIGSHVEVSDEYLLADEIELISSQEMASTLEEWLEQTSQATSDLNGASPNDL